MQADASLEAVRSFSGTAVLDGAFLGVPAALGWVSVGEVLQIPCAITVVGGFQGTVTVSNAILEVEN